MTNEMEKVIRTLQKKMKEYQEPLISREKDPFQVLVSCILSLRTRDAVTARASKRLFSLATSPKKMLTLSEKEIQKAIYPVAFYRVKAKNIRKVCQILEKRKGQVPDSLEELLKLPNVGRKTANIVLVYGFQKEGLPIDIHCHRIPNRMGWIKTKTPEETEMVLRKILPKKYWQDFNDSLVTWGQNVCTPISPWCSTCAVSRYCKRAGVGKSR